MRGNGNIGHSTLGAFGTGAVVLAAVASLTAQAGSPVSGILEPLGFSAAQLKALDAGAAVMVGIDTSARNEVAHIGAISIDVPPARFVERFGDIERFERGPGEPFVQRFRSPPQLDDLSALTLPPEDLDDLRSCRPGHCDLKLPAPAMHRFRETVDWSSPNAARQANQMFREFLLDLVVAYETGGNAALGHYDDGDEPLPVAAQFRELLSGNQLLPTPVPALLSYLDDYPRGRATGAETFFYWSVVKFGLKPTIRVSQVIIAPLDPAVSSGVAYVIAIKQLYASHYFHTTLELRFLVADTSQPGPPGTWLITITRSRNDGMTGFKGLFLRSIITRRSREAVRGYLEHVKRQLERPAYPQPID